jgi:hypothetical protein
MEHAKLQALFDDLIKELEKSEHFGIFCYSSNFARDFGILKRKTDEYRKRFNEAMRPNDGFGKAGEIRTGTGEGNLQGELL